MQKNLYYRDVLRRDNVIKNLIYNFFMIFASPARLLLEVFIRKDFGERYFKFSMALILASCLAFFPLIFLGMSAMMSNIPAFGQQHSTSSILGVFFLRYLSWYIFLGTFVFFSYRHYKAKQRNPSVFDFARYSLYSGRIHPLFYSIQIGGKVPTIRTIECFLEPAFFFCLGFTLTILFQAIGPVIMICSIFYCISYVAGYEGGDNFVMDKIDEMIINEEFEKAFVDGVDENETRGFRFMGRLPSNHDLRTRLVPLVTTDETSDAFEIK